MFNYELQIFPEDHGKPYRVDASRIEGEMELARLASFSQVEYAWEYDDNDNVWRYDPSINIAKTKRALGLGRVWEHTIGLSVPKSLCIPSGGSSTFYHIHPDFTAHRLRRRKTAASFPVQAQIPSSEDIRSSLMIMRDGYKESRIVTSLGTTALTLDIEKVWETGKFSVQLPKVVFNVKDLAHKAELNGFNATLEDVFDQMNNAYQGTLKLSFETLSNTR